MKTRRVCHDCLFENLHYHRNVKKNAIYEQQTILRNSMCEYKYITRRKIKLDMFCKNKYIVGYTESKRAFILFHVKSFIIINYTVTYKQDNIFRFY